MTGFSSEYRQPTLQTQEILSYEDESQALVAFCQAEINTEMWVPISLIKASQSNDNRINESPKAVPAYLVKDRQSGKPKLLLIEGNHRYYGLLEKGVTQIKVIKKANPEY